MARQGSGEVTIKEPLPNSPPHVFPEFASDAHLDLDAARAAGRRLLGDRPGFYDQWVRAERKYIALI